MPALHSLDESEVHVKTIGIVFLAALLGTSLANAQTCFYRFAEVESLAPSNPASGAAFGSDVVADGDRMAIGAYGAPAAGGGASGAVYVFELQSGSWVESARIESPVTVDGDFGISVDLDGDRLIVGASSQPLGALAGVGAIFVFDRAGSAWNYTATLLPSNPQQYDSLGSNLSLSGDTIVAPAGDDSIHVFRRSAGSWSEDVVIQASDVHAFSPVDLDGPGLFAVGEGTPSKEITVFQELSPGVWVPLTSVNARVSHFSLDLHEGVLAYYSAQSVVKLHDVGTNMEIASYLFPIGDYTLEDIAYDGARLVATKDTQAFAYLNLGTPEQYLAELSPTEPGIGQRVVAELTPNGVVTAHGFASTGGLVNNGAVYSFVPVYPIETYGSGCAGAGGFTPTLSADGCVATPTPDFNLRIQNGPGGASALLMAGLTRAMVPIGVTGCSWYVSPIIPLGFVTLSGSGNGNGQFTLNITGYGVTGMGHLVFQAAVVDPTVTKGFTTTNGVDLHFH